MYKLVNLSMNEKTGMMPAIYADMNSCPTTCGLYNTCYGKMGHTAIHFKAAENGVDFNTMIDWIANIPKHIKMWRYGVVGDLPSKGNTKKYLDKNKIMEMAKANKKKMVLAYTHFRPFKDNMDAIKSAMENGFHVNFSCDSIKDIKTVLKNGLSAVTYTTANNTKKSWTENGIKFVTCPNQSTNKKPTCAECQLCAKSRDYVIVFRSHGIAKNKINPVV